MAAVIRARGAAVVDVALTAVVVAAMVFVLNDGGRLHRRHLLAEARRCLALVRRGRRRDACLDDRIVAAAISTHCLNISEPKTVHGLESGYLLSTARWALSHLPTRRRPHIPAPALDRRPLADPSEPAAPRHRARMREKLRTANALDGTDHADPTEQGSMIRRFVIWRNRYADDRRLRAVVDRANTA
ncbi:hypothetical protein PUR49_03435 [Streptomyces sp. BE147]|nr:hypothetical protein [Streptomyces sp. BE147]